MAFTIRDAIATWDTAGPANNLRQGYALGLQRAQAQDAAIRDRQRLEFEAVRLAEQQKTSDFNRVFDQLKFGEEKRQFDQSQQLREQVYGRQVQNDRFDQGMISQGINPNTGARSAGAGGNYAPGYGPGDAAVNNTGGPAFPPIPEPSGPSSTLPPIPGDVENAPPVSTTGSLPSLPDGPVANVDGLLLPGNEITAPPGGEVRNVVTDMPSNPGAGADTALVAAPPPRPGLGDLPQLMSERVAQIAEKPPAPEPVSELDRISRELRERQDELAAATEMAGGRARALLGDAQIAAARAKSNQLTPDERESWTRSARDSNLEAGTLQKQAIRTAREVAEIAAQEKALEARRPALQAIAPLRGVLPEDQLRSIEIAALDPKPSAATVEKLTELGNYAAARQANDWTHESRGVEAARAVGRTYAAMQDPKFIESQRADAEAQLVKPELDQLNRELDSGLSGARKATAELQQKELSERYTRLRSEGLLYRGRVAAYMDARAADVKTTPKKAATTTPATTSPAAAPATSAAAPKPAPGKSLVMDWIETVRKTTPAPVAGPTGARPGIDFPVNRGY